MNKYWKFLTDNAFENKRGLVNTVLTFSEICPADSVIHLLQQTKDIDHFPLWRKSKACIKVFDEYCVKKDIRPVIKRFRPATKKVEQVKGTDDLREEAVNTLVANQMQFPSHKLLALEYKHLEKRTTLIFQRIYGKTAAELITKIRPTSNENSIRIFNFLHRSLSKGIFHADAHLKNMMFDENFENGVFVDLALAFRLNCAVGTGLALQLAAIETYWDGPRSHSGRGLFMSAEKYQSIVFDYLNKHFPKKEEYKNLFLQFYTTRWQTHGWDRLRLSAGGLRKPNTIPDPED